MTTRIWKVYGMDGHRMKESFNASYTYDFSKEDDVRIIDVLNSDKTGTNDFTIIKITRNTDKECYEEFMGQLSDGIFENCRTGWFEEITEIDEMAKAIREADTWTDDLLETLKDLAEIANVPLRDEEGDQREIYYICYDIQKALDIDLGE